ncbi:uncharacterized protein N7477_002067 [Penicillium maclennaniae]|uniref:uncharacterized protein n=1 Tax=Penicillium maclennaniae TaxID=1343394 RepID=UPI002541D648|nr:uncharacterized protein N7477_002067 [Penicillium maclennaniae]KAJ5682127.1 hypothetical protein N7477_002067 [Penicillium maclennaniae]
MCPSTPHVQMDVTQLIFLRALHEAKHCITDMYSAWSPRRGYDKELMDIFAQLALGRDLGSANLAAALATDTNIQVPLPTIFPYCAGVDTEADPFANVFRFAHHPLWLCARAIHPRNALHCKPGCNSWRSWSDGTKIGPWDFNPSWSLKLRIRQRSRGRAFLWCFYANGGGLFANQLYHTAMLLLLQNRPRTARINRFSSAIMSPLWHAQRICSIALNNERRESWDACLLASFLSVSRRMTHESQQEEILCGFRRIQKVTGWESGRLLEDLRAEWRLLEM